MAEKSKDGPLDDLNLEIIEQHVVLRRRYNELLRSFVKLANSATTASDAVGLAVAEHPDAELKGKIFDELNKLNRSVEAAVKSVQVSRAGGDDARG